MKLRIGNEGNIRDMNEKLRHAMNDLQEREQKLLDTTEELRASKDEMELLVSELAAQRDTITEERNQLETIIEEMGEGVLVIDDNKEIVIINNHAREMLGYEKQNEIPIGYRKFFVLHLWKELTESKERVVRKEISLQRPKDITILVTLARLKQISSGFVAVLRDITLEKQVEQMKSDFVANVSHEIRAPMAPMRDAISLILEKAAGPTTEQQEKFLKIVNSNLERLSRLINDLLDLSKIEAGHMEFALESVDIADLITETVDSMKVFAARKEIALSVSCEKNIPTVRVDKDRITQVVINLLNNALKFTPEGGRITVACRLPAPSVDEGSLVARKEVEISVTDTGPGISKEDASKLFDRYKQLSNQIGKRGTGLGLSISKAIVELHGGKIWVESEEGKGCEFKFVLPADSG